MKTINEIQDAIVADFQSIGDSFDQYSYLIELSCAHQGLDEAKKTEDNLVEGCQSSVWLDMRCENGLFYFSSDSNTLILKGVLYILEQMLCAQPLKDVAEADISFLQRTSILDTFESDRRKGIGFVIAKLKNYCKQHQEA